MRRFNVTGVCVPGKHYMTDISDKLARVFLRNGGEFSITWWSASYTSADSYTMSDERLTLKGQWHFCGLSPRQTKKSPQ